MNSYLEVLQKYAVFSGRARPIPNSLQRGDPR